MARSREGERSHDLLSGAALVLGSDIPLDSAHAEAIAELTGCACVLLDYDDGGRAVRRLHKTTGELSTPPWTFYAWCGDLSVHPPSHDFCRQIMNLDYRFAWEVYRREEPTEEKARRRLLHSLTRGFKEWKKLFPGVESP